MAKLYVIGTPIGNLNDLSQRQIETLKSVDFIAAEDTRVTVKLLNFLNIKKPMISCNEFNIHQKVDEILSRVKNGENCGVTSDAGMPCISDPGEILIKRAYEEGVDVTVIPSATALTTALAISGQRTHRFCFEGFLSTSRKSRFEHINELVNEKRTMIFYEAPHKLLKTLIDLRQALGNRKITLARELTKIHEEVIITDFDRAILMYEDAKIKGEFVLIVEGKQEEFSEEITLDDVIKTARELVKGGQSLSSTAKNAVMGTPYKKSQIYNELIKEDE